MRELDFETLKEQLKKAGDRPLFWVDDVDTLFLDISEISQNLLEYMQAGEMYYTSRNNKGDNTVIKMYDKENRKWWIFGGNPKDSGCYTYINTTDKKESTGGARLNRQKQRKDDEYYTPLSFVQSEMERIKEQLKGRAVYLPCDNPEFSNYYKHFSENCVRYGLRALYCTYYNPDVCSTVATVWEKDKDGVDNAGHIVPRKITHENWSGDFRESTADIYMEKCDIVITNLPFSLLRLFVQWIMDSGRDFCILAPVAALGYKNIASSIIKKDIHVISYINAGRVPFDSPSGITKNIAILHLTTLKGIPLKRKEKKKEKKKKKDKKKEIFDGFNIVERGYVADIEKEYKGVQAVPVTYAINPDPFFKFITIYRDTNGKVRMTDNDEKLKDSPKIKEITGYVFRGAINGKVKFLRFLIIRSDEYADGKEI